MASASTKRQLIPSQKDLEGSRIAMVFDSAPGGGTFLSANRSFTVSIRNPAAKWIAMAIVSVTFLAMLAYRIVARRPHPFKRMLETLNDPNFLPWTSKKTARLYIYSSGDKIVESHIIEKHIAQARRVGFPVKVRHFGKSAHVAHMKANPEMYWKAIHDLQDNA